MTDSPDAEALHPLDAALDLLERAPGRFAGRTTPEYWNMAGPFGGVTAGLMLKAILAHPEQRGRPVALTVNFCGAVAEGPFEITVDLVRDGKSTQHWSAIMSQEGRGIATSATAVTGVERETWGHHPARRPEIPAAEALPAFVPEGRNSWLHRYEMRYATPEPRPREPGELRGGLSQFWVRDLPARPLDYPALAAISDSFVIRILQVRGDIPPVATSTLTTYFLADPAALERQGDKLILGVADTRAFRHGFHDQSAELWGDDGELLAVSHQVVWFKG